MSSPESPEKVLESLRDGFMKYVVAKAIAHKAVDKKIIPETVETDIANAKDKSSANHYMFVHLRAQATVEDLKELCSIMKDAEGNSKMNGFGETLEAELDKSFPQQEKGATVRRKMPVEKPWRTRNRRNEDEEDSRECHRRRGYERPRSPLNQRKENAATGRSLMEQARYGLSRAESGAFSLPVDTHGPDSPKEPQVSFAILTANKNENAAVHHFLKLGNPTDTKYRYAKGTWSDDSFLIQTNTKIEPNEGKSENPYRVFDLEVGEKRQMGVHVACDMMGPWGAFETTVKLLKKAKEKGWKLGCIFVIGCCGASVINRKECPRGTVLLANEVTDYLNTGKVVEEVVRRKVVGRKVSGTPLNITMNTMCPRGLHEFENVQTADRLDPHRIEVQIVDFLTGPLVIKDDLFGKAYCKANAKVTGVEMEIVGVIRAVKAFHHISGDPEQKVVLAKGVSDYTGKKGEKGKCKLFGVETPIVDDDQLQMYAALQSLALVIRFVANNIPLILDQST